MHLCDDGGQAWNQRLYTGLRDRFPYVVRSKSKLLPLQGNKIQLEIAIDEVDFGSIGIPPLSLSSTRKGNGLYVTMPLEQLALDSDRDGLTDIAERALFTDLKIADTDGDRIPDGR
jgi:hypothetical protein